MIDKCKIGTIGAGNMGGGLIAGLIAAGRVAAHRITAVDLRLEALEPLRALGVNTSDRLQDGIATCDLVIIGLKPQSAAPLLAEMDDHLSADQILVSIMAGVSTASIEAQLSTPIPVVRVMPQMSARLGEAASGICAGAGATAAHLDLVCALFDEVGSSVVVEESQMDAVTGLSGSGPAYIYTVIEAMADGGVKMGLARDVALRLAAQTALGAGRMVLDSGAHPAVLKDQITSPGGTTIAALQQLEEKGLRAALISAVEAATKRAAELGTS